MTRYAPYGVQILPDGGSLTMIGGVTDQSVDPGTEVNSEVTAGATKPQFGELGQSNSGGRFTCHDISALLQLIGMKGACLTGGATPGFGLWTLQKKPCGELESGTVHRRLVIPNGRIVPQSLNIQQGSRASVTCEVQGIYDGTNNPVIVEASQAAPTGLTDLIGFHLGPVTVAGVTIDRISNLEINFGNQITAEFDDGEIWPKSLNIDRQQPSITITTHNVSVFGADIPLTGKLATHANTSIVLRKRDLGTGSFVAAAEHIALTAGGVVYARETSASGNNPHSMQVMITTLDDQTNEMIVPDYAHSLA